ncbi:PEP-CTERM sorting domain-containing protein [bacterium]|nr:PEP-CTERM sorting domain-containing protein [bacterium]
MRTIRASFIVALFALICNFCVANDEQTLRIATKETVATSGTVQLIKTLQFHMWVDPLRTNWMAWSQYRQAQEWNSQPLIDQPFAGNIGLKDFAVLTVVAPDGARSPEYKMDQNDEQGRSFGPQSVIFGKRNLTPDVARTAPNGDPVLFDEGGVANGFMHDHGPGLYQFELKVYNAYGKTGGTPTLYLLKNAIEGYEVKPPVQSVPYGGIGPYWNDDNGDDDDDDGHNPKSPDLPMGGQFPENMDEGGDIPGGGPFPEEVPIIPEPATMALMAMGLGMMAARLRRR